MKLKTAIMVYGDPEKAFATIHGIAFDSKGAPALQEGHPLTMSLLNEMVASLAKGAENKRSFNGFLPGNVLAVGLGSIVWWLPAEDRVVSFDCTDKQIGQRTGKTPHPDLVFGVNGKNWSVFALKGNTRPTPETPLYQAPYFNVWESGKICQGSAHVPAGATTQQIDGWSEAFFGSNFSHPNIHEAGMLVKYKGGPYRFWNDALDGKFKRFPKRALVATEYTLTDFIETTLNGEEL